jgi:3-oxoacyl-[acyl-carrier-protein] synthase II
MRFYADLSVKTVGPLDGWDQGYWADQCGVLKNTVSALGACTCWTALADAKWKPESAPVEHRTGAMLGLPYSAPEDLELDQVPAIRNGWAKLDRLALLRIIPSLAIGTVTIPYKISGFSNGYYSGNSSGVNAIGQAYRSIGVGEADVIVTGSIENSISPIVLQSYASGNYGINLKADENPEKASRPYDKKSNGWVMSIGGGALVLEDMEHALNRGAHIYAEVAGYSLLSEAGTLQAKEGRGYYRAMSQASKGTNVDAVFGDAPGSADWDIGEARAIEQLFGARPIVSNIKGALGHMQAASSGVNAVIAAHAIKNSVVPPILNLEEPVNANVQFATEKVDREIKTALINSANFDGTMYGSLLFKAFRR